MADARGCGRRMRRPMLALELRGTRLPTIGCSKLGTLKKITHSAGREQLCLSKSEAAIAEDGGKCGDAHGERWIGRSVGARESVEERERVMRTREKQSSSS